MAKRPASDRRSFLRSIANDGAATAGSLFGALGALRASERAGDAPVTVVGIVAEGTGVQLEGRAAAQGGAPAAPGGFDHLG